MERSRSGSRLYGLFSRLSTQDQAKGPTLQRSKKGEKLLAPPSKLDAMSIAPVPRSAPSQSRLEGLWNNAFDALSSSSSDRDLKDFTRVVRENLEQHSTIVGGVEDPNLKVSPELQIYRDILHFTKAQEAIHKEKQ